MTLENAFLRVDLDPVTGGFHSLFDKRSRREYVAAPDRALLFRLMIPDTDRACEHHDGASPEVVLDGSQARLTYRFAGGEAVATLDLDGEAIVARLRVSSTGRLPVEEVMFPLVRGLIPLPGARFVWPHYQFRQFGNLFGSDLGGDHHSWNEGAQKYTGRYPHWMTSAWMDWGDEKGGVALEGRQADFSVMDFFVHKVVEKTFDPIRRTLDMMIVHPRRIPPGKTYETPPVRIVLHEGDWHAVADEHRRWLETWIGKPDRPEKLAEAIGWHFFFMKHQDGHVVNRYADLPKMAEASLAAGCPYLLVFGWQTGGHDNNYPYRYVANEDWGGAEALRRALERCRAMGVEVMPFYNGTLANVELPEHREFGYRWEAKSRSGHPYYAGDWARHNFDAPTRNRAMLHHEICPCQDYRPYFLETMRRIIQGYGFGNTQLDQIAEKMLNCYHPDHGHEHPDRAFVDGLAALLPKVRALIRELNPEGVMISEGLNDFTGQWCDSSWDWNALRAFPEPILFTIPWVFASLEVDALEYGEVNRAFAYKLHLDMKIDGGDSPITRYPQFAAFVKARAELRRRVGEYYVYADFRDEENIERLAADGVITKVFHNRPSRKVGIVIAETEGKKTVVRLRNGWPSGRGTATVVASDGSGEQVQVSDQITVPIAPYEVRVVCIEL